MKCSNLFNKSCFWVASAIVVATLSACSSVPKTTLDGKPVRKIPANVPVPLDTVVIAAVCVPNKEAKIDEDIQIRFGKIFKEGFSTRKMKRGYPEKRNDAYWYVQDLGTLGKLQAFVLPDGYEKKQNLSFVWNIRDRKISYEWTPWLAPDLKIKDISDYVKEEWGLVGREDYNAEEHKSPFLVKFRKITYGDYILEQINHWNIYPIEACEVGDLKKDIWLKPKVPTVKKDEEVIDKEKMSKDMKIQKIIKEVEVSVQ